MWSRLAARRMRGTPHFSSDGQAQHQPRALLPGNDLWGLGAGVQLVRASPLQSPEVCADMQVEKRKQVAVH